MFIVTEYAALTNATHFPHAKGTMPKVKTWYICPA